MGKISGWGRKESISGFSWPIKEWYDPHKQPARKFNPLLMPHMKVDVESLHKRFLSKHLDISNGYPTYP